MHTPSACERFAIANPHLGITDSVNQRFKESIQYDISNVDPNGIISSVSFSSVSSASVHDHADEETDEIKVSSGES